MGARGSFQSVHTEQRRILQEVKCGHCLGAALKRDFSIRRLASQLVEGVVALIEGLRGLRRFSCFCTVPVLWSPIRNPHLVGHDFDCGALFAFPVLPFPRLQSTFDVDVATLVEILTANFRQATEADDLKPLHSFPA